jgi:hypothetical protein
VKNGQCFKKINRWKAKMESEWTTRETTADHDGAWT